MKMVTYAALFMPIEFGLNSNQPNEAHAPILKGRANNPFLRGASPIPQPLYK